MVACTHAASETWCAMSHIGSSVDQWMAHHTKLSRPLGMSPSSTDHVHAAKAYLEQQRRAAEALQVLSPHMTTLESEHAALPTSMIICRHASPGRPSSHYQKTRDQMRRAEKLAMPSW